MNKKTSSLEEQLLKADKRSLSEILKDIPNTNFVEFLEKLLKDNNMSKSDIIRQSSLDKSYAYQIFSGERNAGRNKVLQIALALSCDLKNTNRLLTLSNNAQLYAKVKRDAILIFAISEGYTVLETNELLDSKHYEHI